MYRTTWHDAEPFGTGPDPDLKSDRCNIDYKSAREVWLGGGGGEGSGDMFPRKILF